MGYSTTFDCNVSIEPAVAPELVEYIGRFSRTRHMKRDVEKLKTLFEGKAGELYGYNGELGIEGEYYLNGDDDLRQMTKDDSILNYNTAPSTQPGLWCDFIISSDGKSIEWDQAEKTYDGEEWVRYLIDSFLTPNGYVVNGTINAYGEDSDDRWVMNIENNIVTSTSMDEQNINDFLKQQEIYVLTCLGDFMTISNNLEDFRDALGGNADFGVTIFKNFKKIDYISTVDELDNYLKSK